MESCGVTWIGTCPVAWNVERCAMWNEVECGLRHGAIRGGFVPYVTSGAM